MGVGGGGSWNEIFDKKKHEMKVASAHVLLRCSYVKVASAHRHANILRILRSNPEKRSVEDVEAIVAAIGRPCISEQN